MLQNGAISVYLKFDKGGAKGHYGGMRKVPIFILCLLCLPLLGAATLTQSLEELPWEGKMPIHKSVGLLSDPAKGTHPTVAKSQQAFSSPYGPLWFDHYVATESRTILKIGRAHV